VVSIHIKLPNIKTNLNLQSNELRAMTSSEVITHVTVEFELNISETAAVSNISR